MATQFLGRGVCVSIGLLLVGGVTASAHSTFARPVIAGSAMTMAMGSMAYTVKSRLWNAAARFDRTDIGRVASQAPALAEGGAIDFRRARGQTLTLRQIDAYIDRSITGNDRAFVLREMAVMPPSARRNFELSVGDVDYANTLEGLAALRAQRCTPLSDDTCLSSSGDVFRYPNDVPAANGPFVPFALDAYPNPILPGSGMFYKFTQSYAGTPFSAARGYVSLPQCSTMRTTPSLGIVNDTADTRYYESGGTSPSTSKTPAEEIDAGMQINSSTLTVAAYYLSNFNGKKIVKTASFSPSVPCDPGSANVNPQHYILITGGVISNRTSSHNATWETTLQEYNPNGQPTMVTNAKTGTMGPVIAQVGPIALQSPLWSIDCTSCVVKREINVAQIANGKPVTNLDDPEDHQMYRDVMPDFIPPAAYSDVRFPFGEMVNWRYGTFASGVDAFQSTHYLGQKVQWYPTFSSDNPKNSGALAHWEILALPPSEDPNTGTSGVGVFPAYCQTVGTNPPDYFGAAILCATNVNGKTYQGN